ncbi:Ger(x)C family spore germination protein [Sporosarcina sp. HYO08]|uniref:Ger(x)C family spore germination protein n=1 Tax=Sporosarcina sp. HYO08 TaxID=1759557 RepID=UPI000797ED51|nr:Ger(x)C family spore germination protein [Sporosarcina sp. HYO08]KXH81777.1 hypothetical protein AU377_05795 [Sporosarcina sp. HYO08]
MKKLALISIACSFLLAGCWDERLYKEFTIVPLVGYDREEGELTGYHTYTTVSAPDMLSYSTVVGKGASVKEVGFDANRKIGETLDFSQLQVILVSEEMAKSNLLETFDVLFREPHNRLSSKLAVVEGEIASYMEKTEEMGLEAPDFYLKNLKTAAAHSIIPDINVNEASTRINDKGIDLFLPYIKMSESGEIPELAGVALFSNKVFSGHTLDDKESLIVNILAKQPGKFTVFSYEWKQGNKTYPITVEIARYTKKWNIHDNQIDANYKVKLSVEEFAHNHLNDEKTVKELEQFLSKEMTKDFNKVIKKLQEAKSDAVGFGRTVRAFHPHLWNEGKWQDTFAELDIEVKVKAKIAHSGILN